MILPNETWQPLMNAGGKRCPIWDYEIDDPRWVIYRFVWKSHDTSEVIFYVGSGISLSSKSVKANLRYQYKNGDRKKRLRLPMESELRQKGGILWTEILELGDTDIKHTIDSECREGNKTSLEIVENYFIYMSFQEYLVHYKTYGSNIFRFYNSKIDKVAEILQLLVVSPGLSSVLPGLAGISNKSISLKNQSS